MFQTIDQIIEYYQTPVKERRNVITNPNYRSEHSQKLLESNLKHFSQRWQSEADEVVKKIQKEAEPAKGGEQA